MYKIRNVHIYANVQSNEPQKVKFFKCWGTFKEITEIQDLTISAVDRRNDLSIAWQVISLFRILR